MFIHFPLDCLVLLHANEPDLVPVALVIVQELVDVLRCTIIFSGVCHFTSAKSDIANLKRERKT